MRKTPLLIAGAAVVAVVIIAALAVGHKSNSSSKTTNTPVTKSNTTSYTTVDACKVLTLADAQKVLPDAAKSQTNTPDTSSDAVKVSQCLYYNADSSQVVSVLVRSPKNGDGASSNQAAFGSQKPADAQAVSGYGDAAFWSPTYGQLNVLKHNTWYILSDGSISPAKRTVDQTKMLASAVAANL